MLPLFLGAALLVDRRSGGLDWVAAGFIAVFIVSVFNSWVLLVEIMRWNSGPNLSPAGDRQSTAGLIDPGAGGPIGFELELLHQTAQLRGSLHQLLGGFLRVSRPL